MKPNRKASVQRLRETIHDELGPRLFSAAARLKLLKDELRGGQQARVRAILDELEAMRTEVRRLARGWETRAAGNLAKDLKLLAKEANGRFKNELRQPVSAEKADLIYRIAREASHNAVRHGGASRIEIRLGPGLLSVQDNGSGLARGWRKGMGMRLMQSRARRLGGEVTLQRVVTGGTVLTCHFPPGKE